MVAAPVQPAQSSVETPKEDPTNLCHEHGRKLEIVCINDRVRICSNCALFGKHRGHDIREEPDVVAEITERTELLIEMYQIVEQLRCNPIQRS